MIPNSESGMNITDANDMPKTGARIEPDAGDSGSHAAHSPSLDGELLTPSSERALTTWTVGQRSWGSGQWC
jgi:hypothetical protein